MDWKINTYLIYASHIRDVEASNGIPEDLLAILLFQSSAFERSAIESKNRHKLGSIGIANVTYAAGIKWGLLDQKTGRDGRFNPWASICVAAQQLARLRLEFGEWRRAVIAYKWGDELLRRSLQAQTQDEFPCPQETLTSTDQALRAVGLA